MLKGPGLLCSGRYMGLLRRRVINFILLYSLTVSLALSVFMSISLSPSLFLHFSLPSSPLFPTLPHPLSKAKAVSFLSRKSI